MDTLQRELDLLKAELAAFEDQEKRHSTTPCVILERVAVSKDGLSRGGKK